jgi:hypothetical protein
MKVRTGFVSNSSSASFVVAVKQTEKCPHCGRSDVDFLDLVEQIGAKADYEDTELKARGAQAIWDKWEKDILPYCGEEEKKSYEHLFGLMVEAEHKGYKVGEVEISYRDPSTEALMNDLAGRKSLVVIWSDHYGIKNVQL